MTVEPSPEQPLPLTEEDRRDFLRRASKLALTGPAMAVLLQASSKPAHAQGYQTGPVPTTTSRGLPSDRRLKADVARVGTLANGLGVYTFRYGWSEQRFVGVMADEVEAVMPAAVSTHRSGYKMVDYGMILG